LDDFEQYITSNPDLLSMFTDNRERVRINSITTDPPFDNNTSEDYDTDNRGVAVTYPWQKQQTF
jgi:hypothetical protein